MTYGGDPMPRRRRKREPVPSLPRTVLGKVGARIVCEIKFGDDPGLIVPGSIVLRADPCGVSGADRMRAVWSIVAHAGLDPKVDFNRVYSAIWDDAPDPKVS